LIRQQRDLLDALRKIQAVANDAAQKTKATEAQTQAKKEEPSDVVIGVKNTLAVDVARILDEAFNGPKQQGGGNTRIERIRVTADPLTNRLVVRATPLDLLTLRAILDRLDVVVPAGKIQPPGGQEDDKVAQAQQNLLQAERDRRIVIEQKWTDIVERLLAKKSGNNRDELSDILARVRNNPDLDDRVRAELTARLTHALRDGKQLAADYRVLPLKNIQAKEIAKTLTELFANGAGKGLTIVAEPMTNSLLVRGSSEQQEMVSAIVQRLEETKRDNRAPVSPGSPEKLVPEKSQPKKAPVSQSPNRKRCS